MASKDKKYMASFYFLLILVVFIPLYRFVQGLLEFHTSLSPATIFWLIHWYEPVIVGSVGWVAWRIIKTRGAKLNRSQIIACVLILLGIVSSFFISKSFSRGLEGFRFTLFSLLLYLFVSTLALPEYLKKKIVDAYLALALVVAAWALLEQFLPAGYWGNWGVFNPADLYWYGSHTISGIYQSVSLIGGPNQLASFLLPALFIVVLKTGTSLSSDKHDKCYLLLTTIVLAAALVLTFSRSALVGLVVGVVVYINFFIKNLKFKLNYLNPLLIVILMGLYFVFYTGDTKIKDIFTHGGSQSGHEIALAGSIDEAAIRLTKPMELLFGSGLGSAGPAILKYGGDGILSESWYFQVFFELGIVGLLLWLYFYIEAMILLLKRKQSGIFLGVLSVAVCAIFLHTFADNPAVSYPLFIFLGLNAGNKHE